MLFLPLRNSGQEIGKAILKNIKECLTMDINFYPAPKHLANYVRYFWSCDVKSSMGKGEIVFDNFADRFPRFVFQVEDRPSLVNNDGIPLPQAYICGVDIHPSTMRIAPYFSHFGVSFTPFAIAQIFRIESLMVNSIVDIKDLAFKGILGQLRDASFHFQRMVIMCRFIEGQLQKRILVNQLVQDVVLNNKLLHHHDLFRVQQEYKISERTLERLFKRSIGVSPKTFQRLVRFESALKHLNNSPESNSGAGAYVFDYTDQSHFIKEFKLFSNLTPAQFQKNSFLISESSAFITAS